MATFFALTTEALRWLTFVAIGASTILFALAHRKSRATVFTDVAIRATALVVTFVYLAFIQQNAPTLGDDPAILTAAAGALLFLLALFLLSLAASLWRLARRTEGIVIVTPSFLVGLRSRMTAMYGPTSASFASYAVGKESSKAAIVGLLSGGFLRNPKAAWKRLPSWFHTMGYGRLDYVARDPGTEVRLRVRESFETTHPLAERCACDLTRGYLAGMGEALVPGRTCEATETSCRTFTGGDACEFTLRWFDPLPATPVAVGAPMAEAA